MENLKNKNITLLITGSIAAYKTPELVRLLVKEGANVRAVLSNNAKNFVTELTLQTVSKNKVFTDMFDLSEEMEIGHIALPDSSDLILVAPASANILAKAALGLSDDLLSTILLASIKPVVFCPGMNVNMWNAETTKEYVCTLKERGHHFIEPTEGELACGWVGQGRMEDPENILDQVKQIINLKTLSLSENSKVLENTKIIVTAGPTREMIDPIRFISNKSTGKMGYCIAEASKFRGGQEVVLISGPTTIKVPDSVSINKVESASEMEKNLISELEKPTNCKKIIVFMASAVSDHKPRQYSDIKLKYSKTEHTVLDLIINPDIICNVSKGRNSFTRKTGVPIYTIGFCAETGTEKELLEYAKKKLVEKELDIIVANFSEENMGTDSGTVWVINKKGKIIKLGPKFKSELSYDIIDTCLDILNANE